MTNLSKRLDAATKKSALAQKRMLAAEKQIMETFLANEDSSFDEVPPPLPKTTPTPATAKASQPKK